MYRQVIDTAVEKMKKTTNVYQDDLRARARDGPIPNCWNALWWITTAWPRR